MRPAPIHKSEAFTRIELIVVVVVIIVASVLLSMMSPRSIRDHSHAPRFTCLNNLHQIGFAYGVWANDHNERYPALQSRIKGGWSELLTNPDQGSLCWTNYVIMANELGQAPKVLVCPSDARKPSDTFSNLVSNTNLSYFVGVSADNGLPKSLQGGDRNVGPGNQPDPDYGFSPESGKGNDVAVPTNSQASPVCWSSKMHTKGKSEGAGNILLGDGSAQEVNTLSFRTNWLSHADPTTNWPFGHLPASPSIRILFP